MNEPNGKPAEKSCEACAFCSRIYAPMGYSVYPLEEFFCNVADEMTESTHSCPHWQKKTEEKPDLSLERFQKAEEDIRAIKAIMKKFTRSIRKKARR